jgi:hypothetical protein
MPALRLRVVGCLVLPGRRRLPRLRPAAYFLEEGYEFDDDIEQEEAA